MVDERRERYLVFWHEALVDQSKDSETNDLSRTTEDIIFIHSITFYRRTRETVNAIAKSCIIAFDPMYDLNLLYSSTLLRFLSVYYGSFVFVAFQILHLRYVCLWT